MQFLQLQMLFFSFCTSFLFLYDAFHFPKNHAFLQAPVPCPGVMHGTQMCPEGETVLVRTVCSARLQGGCHSHMVYANGAYPTPASPRAQAFQLAFHKTDTAAPSSLSPSPSISLSFSLHLPSPLRVFKTRQESILPNIHASQPLA